MNLTHFTMIFMRDWIMIIYGILFLLFVDVYTTADLPTEQQPKCFEIDEGILKSLECENEGFIKMTDTHVNPKSWCRLTNASQQECDLFEKDFKLQVKETCNLQSSCEIGNVLHIGTHCQLDDPILYIHLDHDCLGEVQSSEEDTEDGRVDEDKETEEEKGEEEEGDDDDEDQEDEEDGEEEDVEDEKDVGENADHLNIKENIYISNAEVISGFRMDTDPVQARTVHITSKNYPRASDSARPGEPSECRISTRQSKEISMLIHDIITPSLHPEGCALRLDEDCVYSAEEATSIMSIRIHTNRSESHTAGNHTASFTIQTNNGISDIRFWLQLKGDDEGMIVSCSTVREVQANDHEIPENPAQASNINTGLIIGLTLGVFALVITILMLVFYKKWKGKKATLTKTKSQLKSEHIYESTKSGVDLHDFSRRSIQNTYCEIPDLCHSMEKEPQINLYSDINNPLAPPPPPNKPSTVKTDGPENEKEKGTPNHKDQHESHIYSEIPENFVSNANRNPRKEAHISPYSSVNISGIPAVSFYADTSIINSVRNNNNDEAKSRDDKSMDSYAQVNKCDLPVATYSETRMLENDLYNS